MAVTVCAAAGTTWAAGGFPLQNWKLTASFQGMHTSHTSLYPVCHFFTKCSGSSDLCGFLPSVKHVKADQWVHMLGEKAEIIEIQCPCPSLMSFVSLGNQAKRHVLISALFLHCKFGALFQEVLIAFVISSVVC